MFYFFYLLFPLNLPRLHAFESGAAFAASSAESTPSIWVHTQPQKVLFRNKCGSCSIRVITDKEIFRFWHVNMFPAHPRGQEAEHSHSSSPLHRLPSEGSDAGAAHRGGRGAGAGSQRRAHRPSTALLFPGLVSVPSSHSGSVVFLLRRIQAPAGHDVYHAVSLCGWSGFLSIMVVVGAQHEGANTIHVDSSLSAFCIPSVYLAGISPQKGY